MGRFERLGALRSLGRRVRARLVGPPFRTCTPDTPPAIEASLRKLAERGRISGDYLEFGVYQGYTLLVAHDAARRLGFTGMRFFGFDSFQGLPEPVGVDGGWQFKKGDYAYSRERAVRNLTRRGLNWERTFLVEGFYDQTLTSETKTKYGIRDVALALVDCDLYSSAQAVLRFLEGIVGDGTIVLFDDWNCFDADANRGERRAFAEFLARNSHITAEEYLAFGWHGQGFILNVQPIRGRT